MAMISKRTLLLATLIILKGRHRCRSERQKKYWNKNNQFRSPGIYRKEFVTLAQLISMFHTF